MRGNGRGVWKVVLESQVYGMVSFSRKRNKVWFSPKRMYGGWGAEPLDENRNVITT
jgi:hypothetical protein